MSNDKKLCKHLWTQTFAERSLETEMADLVTVGIYCPKCLSTNTLEYIIPRGRTNNEQLDTQTEEWSTGFLRVDFGLIETNLSKLSYTKNEIIHIYRLSRVGNKLNFNKFQKNLKEDHQVMAESIINSELL